MTCLFCFKASRAGSARLQQFHSPDTRGPSSRSDSSFGGDIVMPVAALETSSSRCKAGARYRSRSGRIPFADLRCALPGLAICCASSVPLGLPFLIRILRHRPEIVLGVLEIILRRDPVSRQSFGAGQHQIALIVSFRALSVSRLGAGEPGRFISAGGPRASRRRAGRDFRIWAWLCCCGFKF